MRRVPSKGMALGFIAGVVLVVVALVALVYRSTWMGNGGTEMTAYSPLGEGMNVDALVSASSIRRLDDTRPEGGTTPYPTFQISGVEVLAHATTRLTEPEGPTFDFPPLGDPQWVSGHALSGPIQPVPDFEGTLLAGIYVGSHQFESAAMPLWKVEWVAQVVDDGEVTIYEGGEARWDAELASLAQLLERDDQRSLLIDWVEEKIAEREGALMGPITMAYAEAFLPEAEPVPAPPSIEVPVVVVIDESVASGSSDKLVVRPESLNHAGQGTERPLSEGSGGMTALMTAQDRMIMEVWSEGLPIAGTAIELADWTAVMTGDAGGISVEISQNSGGTYWVNSAVLGPEEFADLEVTLD